MTVCFSFEPALKRGTRDAAIWIVSPVRGFTLNSSPSFDWTSTSQPPRAARLRSHGRAECGLVAPDGAVPGRHHVTDLAELNRLFTAWVETEFTDRKRADYASDLR